VENIVDGSKITRVYDLTQRQTEIDPDVEAIVRRHGREIPGDVIAREVTCTGPNGVSKLVRKLKVPVKAGLQDLGYRLCLAMKIQENFGRFLPLRKARA
jgi:hypothetical protein